MLILRAIARACVVLTFALATPAWADQAGVEIKGSLQGEEVVTRLSAEGMVTTFSRTGPNGPTPVRGFVARYADDKIWAIDFEHQVYSEQTSAAAIEQAQARLNRMMQSRTGGAEIDRRGELASFTTLPGSSSANGVKLQGIGVETRTLKFRVWVAPNLPRLPKSISQRLPALTPSTEASKGLLGKIAGMPVVRTEAWTSDGWRPVLDVDDIRSVVVATSELVPPAGLRPVTLAITDEPLGTPPGAFDVPANAVTGPGPVMAHPELYVVFWGPALNDPAHAPARRALQGAIGEMSKQAYVKHLGQYGIYDVKVNGLYSRPDSPPRSVGSTNFAAAAAMVYDVGFKEQAPIFWWVFGDHDPLYTLLVTRGEVDAGSPPWGGYHFVAFSLTHAVLPFPASLFAHDAIPFAVDKVDDGALVMPQNAVFDRARCRTVPPTLPPAACNPLDAFDRSTGVIAHELVEAATDPYPFFGWSDPGQQPAAVRSELVDLCQQNTLQWMRRTVVGVTSVQTYWSNMHSACVPDPRPTLEVLEPAEGQAYAASSGFVMVQGSAIDPGEGDISQRIQWSLDGTALGIGDKLTAHPVAGAHTLTALIMSSSGAMSTLDRNFNVVAKAPTVEITSPPVALNLGADQTMVLRGRAFEISPGDIPDSALRWTIDGVAAGSGPMAEWRPSGEGAHLAVLSATSPSGVIASASRNFSVGPATGRPIVIIRSPLSGSAVEVDASGTRSAPVQFVVDVTDASGASVPAIIRWRSSLDGVIGTGRVISVPLSGARCSLFTHKISVSAQTGKGKIGTDVISFSVGRVAC